MPAPALPRPPRRQRGAALLLAMLIVALVASFAAAASWQQWRSIQAETDERAQAQAAWLIRGALDWAKIVLYLDKRSNSTDDLNEPWTLPLAEARLSTFLAAENNVAQNANADMTEAFFSGGVTDLQGRLNVTNLVNGSTIDPLAQRQFERLFEALGLPVEQATRMAEQYLAAVQADGASGDGDGASSSGDAPLAPTCTDQLNWLGLDSATIAQIRPYVTVLPARTTLNLNTAPELVLWAGIVEADQALAAKLAAVRRFQPFDSVAAVQALAGEDIAIGTSQYGVATSYFLVAGSLRLDSLQTASQYVLLRDGNRLSTVRRECSSPYNGGVFTTR